MVVIMPDSRAADHQFAADYPELSRLVVRLLRDLYSPESTVFQPVPTPPSPHSLVACHGVWWW